MLDGLLMFPDGLSGHLIPTAPLIGARLLRRLGHIWPPEYVGLWCDNALKMEAESIGRLAVTDEDFGLRHRHWSTGQTSRDSLSDRYSAEDRVDRDRYISAVARARSEPLTRGLPLSRIPALDIGINTTPNRYDRLTRIVADLDWQIEVGGWFPHVAVLVLRELGQRFGGPPLGDSRNRILDAAASPFRWVIPAAPGSTDTPVRRPSYVAFVDDDDEVSPRYIEAIMTALLDAASRGEYPDCVSTEGRYYARNQPPERFVHDLEYNGQPIREWVSVRDVDGRPLHLRMPNHLNPVRSDIAARARFDPVGYAEDRSYSGRLLPLLRTIVRPDHSPDTGAVYHYHYDHEKSPEYVA
jgi:hypothetical protein